MTQPDFLSGRSNVTGHDSIQQLIMKIMGLEAKIDTLLATQRLRDEAFNGQLIALRGEIADHETRLRLQEARRIVEPKTVWTAIGLLVTFGGLVVAIINLVTR